VRKQRRIKASAALSFRVTATYPSATLNFKVTAPYPSASLNFKVTFAQPCATPTSPSRDTVFPRLEPYRR